jgi:hypothetical protein
MRWFGLMASLVLVAPVANASSLGLTDTVTYPGSVSVSSTGTTTGVTPTVSYSLGNAFNGSALTDFPSSVAPGSGGPWNFYDDYVFTVMGAASVESALVSFSNGVDGVSDLQARIFSTTTPYTSTVAASNLGNPPASGSVVDDGWETTNSGDLYTVELNSTVLAPGTYDLQVRGEVGTSGSGSYGGSVTFTAVPLPPGIPLLISGLGFLGAAAARRRRLCA